MNFERIITNYNDFYNYIQTVHSILSFIIVHLDKYLAEYKQNNNYDEIHTDNLEINLANLKNIYFKLDDIIELTKNITLSEIHLPAENNAKIYDINDYKELAEDYEQDIDVDLDNSQEISKIWHNPDSKLKLCKNDEFDNI